MLVVLVLLALVEEGLEGEESGPRSRVYWVEEEMHRWVTGVKM
jgi:hypothetical protein